MTRLRLLSMSLLAVACSKATPEPEIPVTLTGNAISITTLAPGDAHCAQGGTQIETTSGIGFSCNGPQGAQGPQGAPGPQGNTGPAGAQGVAGPPGLKGDRGANGTNGTNGRDNVLGQVFQPFTAGTIMDRTPDTWTPLNGSAFTFTTRGGPLEVFMDVTLGADTAGSTAGCRPMVDDQWMGIPAGIPFDGDRRAEGVVGLLPFTPVLWAKTRLYRGITAGAHRFSIQCWGAGQGDAATVFACGSLEATCGWGFVELSR